MKEIELVGYLASHVTVLPMPLCPTFDEEERDDFWSDILECSSTMERLQTHARILTHVSSRRVETRLTLRTKFPSRLLIMGLHSFISQKQLAHYVLLALAS
jgi:hypothetical protein